MKQKELEQLISEFRYEQKNVIDGELFVLKEQNGTIILENFYLPDPERKTGICSDLSQYFYDVIEEQSIETAQSHIYFAKGYEPNYFNKRVGSQHHFLLLFDEPIDSEKQNISSNGDDSLQKLLNKNPLILDPSFQKIIPFENSGYEILSMRKNGYQLSSDFDLIMNNNKGYPICFCDSEIMYVAHNKNAKNTFDIGFQKPNTFMRTYSLYDPRVDQKAWDFKRAKQAVQNLRQAEKNTIYL